MPIIPEILEFADELSEIRRDIHAHPELGFTEERTGDLVAQKFDLARLELGGAVLPVVRQIQYHTFLHNGAFTVSTNGILVYGTAGTGVNSQMAWLDRTGKTIGTLGEPGLLMRQSISPDGKRVAVGISPSDTREKI